MEFLKYIDIVADANNALHEDVGQEDVSSLLLPSDLIVKAKIISREPMLVCGIPWVQEVFLAVDKNIEINWLVEESSWQPSATTLCEITGYARSILTAERTALNFMQTLSGTATKTHFYIQKLSGSKTKLLDTRKTIPGLRLAQKYAVACGGGTNHRLGLYDAYLIKENHIKACGGIKKAVLLAKELRPDLFVEVEVESISELLEVLELSVDRIMLDNFSHDMLLDAVKICEPYQIELEVSGNINLETISEVAKTGVDYISVGALTKSIQAIDLSLLILD
ncbi:MAG: nicotinate-nucleotide diphosphorylase (carboxylating) [Legionellales bacterium RIFCSPHIGHO2_12_FULL_35_11]|nr:MAG: nicotinate-nucleotide diphosphorylase (carboxylating) [Legionellales bacterium RIFCSPHIGHO2_12_FULL_35_11]